MTALIRTTAKTGTMLRALCKAEDRSSSTSGRQNKEARKAD